MFPMTVTINTMTEFEGLMAAIKAGVPTTAAKVEAVVAEAGGTKGKKSPAKDKAEGVQATVTDNGASSTPETALSIPAEAAAQEPAPTAAPSAPVAESVSYQATADAVTKLARTKGRDAAVAVLAQFGAQKLPDIKPEQFAAVVAACESAGA